MKDLKRRLILSMFVVLSLFIMVGNCWSEGPVGLPTAIFGGDFQTTAGVGVGSFTFPYTEIYQLNYQDGTAVYSNTSGSESLIGAHVVISGATRTDSYSFNGDPANPNDVTLSITDGSYTYFLASLLNVELSTDGMYWYLNPYLDVNNPGTLNLANIVLNTDAAHPSRYITELASALGSQNSGMKMVLWLDSGDIASSSYGYIIEGLIDGVPPITNTPPTANAGENINISSEQIPSTIIQGTASDADLDALECRWSGEAGALSEWAPAGINGECPLDLSTISIGFGTYTLTLEVRDATSSDDDTMLLTIENSAPHAVPAGGGVYELGADVILTGVVSDFDGDLLSYDWSETDVLCLGIIQAVAEGYPVVLPECVVSNLGLGMHTISLKADDGLNLPDSNAVEVEIVDTAVPTLSPEASQMLLWPPNHVMVDIVIEANASDNSGLPVTLSAIITSNEPEDGLGDGDTGPDWTEAVIDQNTGMIYLQLRRERSGSGDGRVYTVTITATDSSGNFSTTALEIMVPHDKGKK